MEIKYINASDNYKTFRHVLQREFHISNNLLTRLKKEKAIFLNGKFTYLDKEIKIGDIIEVNFNYNEENEILPVKQNLTILYEDDWLLVLSKPPGIPVHPSMGHYSDSISNGVSAYFNEINLNKKVRAVNRLDLGTSGIVIFAKNEYIQEELKRQKDNNIFKKEYIAILTGHIDKDFITIDAPISRKENSIIERKVDFENGYHAVSHMELIEKILYENEKLSLVKYSLETGRTHQLRIHSSYIGHPILGDTLYGTASNHISHQALHAYKVSFDHPISHRKIEIIDENYYDMAQILKGHLMK